MVDKNKTPTVIEIIGMGSKKYGGLEKFIIEECRQLKTQGVHLLVVFNVEPICKEYVQDLLVIGGEYCVIPNKTSPRKYYRTLKRLLKSYHVVAVHSNFGGTLSYIVENIISRSCGVRTHIITEHCLPDLNSLRRRLTYTLFACMCSKILCVSKKTADTIKKGIFAQKGKVIPEYLGVNDICFNKSEMIAKYDLDINKVNIVNIAYHNPVKGVDVLLKAIDILVHQRMIKDFLVCQIGGGQDPEQTKVLHDLEDKLGIKEYIRWVGITNDVPEWLSACDIYVQPSRSEGIPLSIMEASMVGIPSVGTKVGGIVESIKDMETGFVVEPENPQALAEALERLITSKELCRQMGDKARKHALQNFYIERNVSKLIDHYGVKN